MKTTCMILCLVPVTMSLPVQISFGEDEMTMEMLMTGLRVEREKLRTGVFRLSGTNRVVEEQRSIDDTRSVKGYGAFDVDRGLFRFDSSGSILSRLRDDHSERKVWLSPDENVFYFGKYSRVEIHNPEVESPQSMPGVGKIFDVRGLGIYSVAKPEGLFEQAFRKRVSGRLGPASVSAEDREVYRITRVGSVDPQVIDSVVLWIDTSRGYTPIRMEHRMQLAQKPGVGWLDLPHSVQEIAWTNIDDAWLPSRYRGFVKKGVEPKDSSVTPPAYRTRESIWRISWEKLNKPLDGDVFDYEECREFPDGTAIADGRSGEVIVLDVIGAARPWKATAESSRARWFRRRVVLGIGAALIVVSAIVSMVYRRRR